MRNERGWFSWRLTTTVLGCFFVLAPLSFPVIELIQSPTAWKVWEEWDRIGGLLLNTAAIAAGSSLIAIILGGVTAILLARSSLQGRRLWAILLSVGLFIPLPMLLSGWYMVVQSFGAPLPALWPIEARWLGTVLIHALIGLPWVVLVLSLGLCWVEPELEEEMSLYTSFPRVLRHIILPRCWPFVGMAVLLVSWPTWHEITATDFFKVRTLAEEVYLQLNGGSMEEGPRALAAALPCCLLMVGVAGWMMQSWRRHCPPSWPTNASQRRLQLGSNQVLGQLWMMLIVLLLLVTPLFGLVKRAGMHYGESPHWSLQQWMERMGAILHQQSIILIQSLTMAGITGLLAAASVLLLVWLARGSKRLETVYWWTAALLWAIPGPLLGLAFLSFIQFLIQMPGKSFWSAWLYSEPSMVPNIWVAWLRFLPLAWLIIWPVARLLPVNLEDATRLEGATPWQRFLLLYWPRLWKATCGIALGVALLTLGEISASKLVTTPGFLPMSHHLFQQLHAGADTEVAALSIVLLLPALCTALGVTLGLGWSHWRKLRKWH